MRMRVLLEDGGEEDCPHQGDKVHVEQLQLWGDKVEIEVLCKGPHLEVQRLCLQEVGLEALPDLLCVLARNLVHERHLDSVEARPVHEPVQADLVEHKLLPLEACFARVEELEPKVGGRAADAGPEEDESRELLHSKVLLLPPCDRNPLTYTIPYCRQDTRRRHLGGERVLFIRLQVLVPPRKQLRRHSSASSPSLPSTRPPDAPTPSHRGRPPHLVRDPTPQLFTDVLRAPRLIALLLSPHGNTACKPSKPSSGSH
mmetsp:Transcript_31973/g.74733  ORF Transcript_31973/g.74733 Transcript_31973/m.74733 type:complete len:257 (-) Transcript_31973:29-799(-)